MGYLAKHIKVRRHKRAMRIIAMAALAGCTFVPWRHEFNTGRYNTYGYEIRANQLFWRIIWPDGQISANHVTKRAAAMRYMKWFLGRHDPLEELQRRANA